MIMDDDDDDDDNVDYNIKTHWKVRKYTATSACNRSGVFMA